MLLFSVVIGGFFGMIFGLFDVEDARGNLLDLRLLKEEYYCIPVAALLGGIGGAINEILRTKGAF